MEKKNETNEPGIEVFDLKKGIDKKLNNLLNFEDFDKTFKPEEQKKTKRTDVGLDIIKESNLIFSADPNLKALALKTINFLKGIKPFFDDEPSIMEEINSLIKEHRSLTKDKHI